MSARLKARVCVSLFAALSALIISYEVKLFIALVAMSIVGFGLYLVFILLEDALTEIFEKD